MDSQIAGILNISLADWQSTKKRALVTDRITVDKNNVIRIVNWKQYQSEYGRVKDAQKEYRQRKKDESWLAGPPEAAGFRGTSTVDQE